MGSATAERARLTVWPGAAAGLAPLLDVLPLNSVENGERIHDSGFATTFRLRLSEPWRGARELVVKRYRPEWLAVAGHEVERLGVAERINSRLSGHDVGVPEVLWSSPEHGLLAMRALPGDLMATVLRRVGRRWRRKTPGAGPESADALVHRLVAWHGSFAAETSRDATGVEPFADRREQWEKWIAALPDLRHLPRRWREATERRLATVNMPAGFLDERRFLFHGDLQPGNVLVESGGRLWVLDWLRLERGHWIDGIYRLAHALRISSLSPLAKGSFYAGLAEEALRTAWATAAEREQRPMVELHAALRLFYYACAAPPSGLRGHLLQRYAMRELRRCLDAVDG